MSELPRPEQSSLILSPEQLAEFARIDPNLPTLIVAVRDSELRRQFSYAIASLAAGVLVVFAILATFAYLVVLGHTEAATALLGIGVVALVGGFVRSRL